MPKMPTLGPQPRRSGAGRFVVFALLLAGGVAGYQWWNRHRGGLTTAQPVASTPGTPVAMAPLPVATTAAPAPVPVSAPVPGGAPVVAAAPVGSAPAGTAPVAAAPTGVAPVGAAPAAAPGLAPVVATPAPVHPAGPRHVSITMEGPLETAIVAAAGKDVGPALAQVVTRELVWWVTVPGDLRRNDKIDFVYEEKGSEEPQVDALRLVSTKFGKTFQAFRYKAPGDNFSRFYMPGGEEMEMRLRASPLDTYEQITSLIRDGRHHKGVDLKTPVGTVVHPTFAGTVARTTWKFHANGNSIEVVESAAPHRHAMYLHLSAINKGISAGKKLERGDAIALSGNTGHSFAPHLHYQLMSADDRVLDPFESQETFRRAISAANKPGLDAEIARWEAMMAPAGVATTGAPTP